MSDLLKQKLRQLATGEFTKVIFDEPLSRHSSWKIGGKADLFIEPETTGQIVEVLNFAHVHSIPLVIIGQGTNLLFDDVGVRGIVLKIGERMSAMQISGSRIVAAGGVWVPQLARLSMRAGLRGLEHCIGIPGTLGGLVMMNGGSQRRGIGENVVKVEIVDSTGELRQLNHSECHFSYRHSALQGTGCVVVGVELTCPEGNHRQVRRDMLIDLQARRQKFPRKQPNCGSVFLSTAEMHATVGPPGRIIEDCGFKGLRIGQAEVSRQHANFIINLGNASSLDVLSLITRVRKGVLDRIGFELCCEVRYVSPEGKILPAHLKAAQFNL